MRFVLATQEFNYLIGKLQTIVSQKPAMPILSNFLIEAKNQELILTASDQMVGIQCRTEAKIFEEGAITLPTRRFAQLLREISSMQVEVSCGEDPIVDIVAGEARFKLPGMRGDAFPSLPDMGGAVPCRLPKDELRKAFYRTAFAVSRDDNRYVLTGVLFHVSQGKATLIGTDGKRLARVNMSIPEEASFEGEYVLPIKAVDEIIKNLNEDEESVILYFLPDKMAVEVGGTRLVTKLLQGNYPNVAEVIPTTSTIDIAFEREPLIGLLRQVSLFTSQEKQSICFSFVDGSMHLNAQATDIGEGNVSMACGYQGDPFHVSFNPKFMLQILDHSEKEQSAFKDE